MKTKINLDGIEYEVEFEVEAAQNGGMFATSWDAHIYDLAISQNGKVINPEDLDDDGYDHTDLYSDMEKMMNKKLLERDL